MNDFPPFFLEFYCGQTIKWFDHSVNLFVAWPRRPDMVKILLLWGKALIWLHTLIWFPTSGSAWACILIAFIMPSQRMCICVHTSITYILLTIFVGVSWGQFNRQLLAPICLPFGRLAGGSFDWTLLIIDTFGINLVDPYFLGLCGRLLLTMR